MNTISTSEAKASTEIMKAAWYNQTGSAQAVLQLGKLPLPSPGPGEVRVRVHTSGINPSDIASRSGSFKHLSIQTVRDRGRLVWISSEDPSGPPSERGIQGTMFYARAEAKSLDRVTALIDAGKLTPFIEDVLPLEQAKEAQQRVASGRVRGKLVLKIS